jgi:hypothetical protein
MKTKKSIMNTLVGIFIIILVVAIIIGITFLFTANLKTTVQTASTESNTVINETGFINQTGYQLLGNSNGNILPSGYIITALYNRSSGLPIAVNNATVSASGIVTNSSAIIYNNASISYTYSSVNPTGYNAVNSTEAAGATVVNYIPLIFLALIFGAILVIILKVILPYMNIGGGKQESI